MTLSGRSGTVFPEALSQMHLNSLSSFSPIESRPGVGAARSPYVVPTTLTAMDSAEIGSVEAPSANVYQAMQAAVSATPEKTFSSSKQNLVKLGRAEFTDAGPAPAVVPGPGDDAFVTSGATLFRMKPDGTLTELSKEKAGPLSPPVVDKEGNVYYRARTGEVVGIGADGKEMWRTATNGRSQMANQERVGLFPDGGLWAIQLEGSNEVVHGLSREGKLDWTFKLDPAERLVGVGPNGTLYTEKHEDGGNRVLHAIQPTRWLGKRRWKAEGLSSKLPTAWVTPQGQPVVLRKDGTLSGLDNDGKDRWSYKGSIETVLPSPDGAVYVLGDQKRELTRLSADGAQERQERSENKYFVEAAVGPDGTLYAINTDQKIQAIRPDGARTEADYPFHDTTRLEVTPGGVVYSGTRRSNLSGMKQVANEVVTFRMREPGAAAPAAPEAPKTSAPEPVPTPQDGWIVIGDISLPVRQ